MNRHQLKNALIFNTAKGYKRKRLEQQHFWPVYTALNNWRQSFLDNADDSIRKRIEDIAQLQKLSSEEIELSKVRDLVDRVLDSIERPSLEDYKDILFQQYIANYQYGLETVELDVELEKAFLSKAVTEVETPYDFTVEDIAVEAEKRAGMTAGTTSSTTVNKVRDNMVTDVIRGDKTFRSVWEKMERLGLPHYRAYKIVQTESQAAVSTARHQVFTTSGAPRKQWVTVGDNRVRPEHVTNEGVGWIDVKETFPNGALHPGDGPSAINCRCVAEYDIANRNILLPDFDFSLSGSNIISV